MILFLFRQPATFLAKKPVMADRAPVAPAGLAGLIGGLAAPILCLGCLSSLALIGLFATMIAAATYMSM